MANLLSDYARAREPEQAALEPYDNHRQFTLRQIHHRGVNKFQHLHRYAEISEGQQLHVVDEHGVVLPPDDALLLARDAKTLDHWSDMTTEAQSKTPDTTDKQTVLSFAKMAANAYARKDNSSDLDWHDVGSGFNYTNDFGWEYDGLRGHVFADERNQTIVISIKGTSVPWLDDPATTLRDLQNDNLFGSCCCGQGGPAWWKKVCKCQLNGYTCNSTCLTNAFHSRTSYYWAAEELYYNITMLYPGADVWMTGHSLGGVVSALLGLTFGLPTLTYEAFPDALAAARLGLPTPPGYNIGDPKQKSLSTGHIHHFGHTADPIYMGTCGGDFSFCSGWGYAFEGKCHTGHRYVYDTVKDLGWSSSVRTHSIVRVIKEIIDVYEEVPKAVRDIDCRDCEQWSYFKGI